MRHRLYRSRLGLRCVVRAPAAAFVAWIAAPTHVACCRLVLISLHDAVRFVLRVAAAHFTVAVRTFYLRVLPLRTLRTRAFAHAHTVGCARLRYCG